MKTTRVLAVLFATGVVALVACGGSAPDARYPAREDGCPDGLFILRQHLFIGCTRLLAVP